LLNGVLEPINCQPFLTNKTESAMVREKRHVDISIIFFIIYSFLIFIFYREYILKKCIKNVDPLKTQNKQTPNLITLNS